MLGHQGGWDEALFVVVPILVLGALLFYAYVRKPSSDVQDESAVADPADNETDLERQ